MKRKLFSAILFGALLVTSTSGLTSCKDYDDDITNLQGQIDKLATKDELSAKANELATSISAAQTAASAAADVAKAAQTAANNASSAADAADKAAKAAADAAKAAQNKADEVDGKLTTAVTNAAQQIQDAVKDLATKQQVTDAVKEVKDKYDAQARDLTALGNRVAAIEKLLGLEEGAEAVDLVKVREDLDDIEDAFEALVGVVSDMVTSVELVYNSQDYKYNGATAVDCPNDLAFTIVTEQDNVFGKGVADNTIETKKGHTLFEGDEVYVRVNPVDADLTASDFSLINSKGEELTGLVEATKVERYSGSYMTRAAGANTGLWKVTFAPVTGAKADDLNNKFSTTPANPTTSGKYIVYAVAVKSAISDSIASDRRVVSAYDITMKTAKANAYAAYIDDYQNATSTYAGNLVDIVVNKKSIKDLKNRTSENGGLKEKVWKNDITANPYVISTHATLKDQSNNNLYDEGTTYDKRSSKNYLVAGLGEDINIVFKDYNTPAADKKIKAFYVTLDEKFAYESSPSEINAWKSYTYENLGHMFNGNEGTIKVSALSGTAINDIIGFRIYALNLDGTLIDPDGIAFYVSVGNKGGENTLAAQTINVTKGGASVDGAIRAAYNGKNVTGDIDVTDLFKDAKNTGSGSTGAVTWTCSKGADNVTPKIDGTTARNDYAYTIWYHNVAGNGGTPAAGWNQTFDPTKTYDKIRVQILKPQAFVDGATYTLTATVNGKSNSTDYTLRTIKVDVTKAMPTEVPAFRFKPQQSSDQLVTASSYTVQSSSIDGTIDINNIFVQNDGTLFDNTEIGKWYMWMSASTTSGNNIVDLKANGLSYNNQTGAYGGTASSKFTIKKDFIKANTVDHKLKGHYTYGNIGYKKINDTYTAYEYILPFESTDVVRYHTWSEIGEGYQTYSWKVYSKTTNNVTTTYTNDKLTIASPVAPATAGEATLNLWDIASTTGAKSAPSFDKGNLDVYVGSLKWLTFTKDDVTLTVDGLDNIYYKATAVNLGQTPYDGTTGGNTITFTAQQSTDNIPAHTAELKIKVKDCFGIEQTIKLNVRFVKP